MNTQIFNKINGYLEGLSNINSHFGNCYGHQYQFCEVDLPIEEAVRHYNKTSHLAHHDDINYLPLAKLENWQESLFKISADWFFFVYRLQNFEVKFSYFDDQGELTPEIPAEYDKDSNRVSNKLIEWLEAFIGDREATVYRMVTEIDDKYEFDWEQLYFEIDHKVFVQEFYQWG
ncbi:conserved hypothetical protein [Paenibacillus curdlanolyticus YK9]|uniref:Uncharacterized protein n=1 Tax=Paenibacillus curdlanolyticus YK9 TaxID=717606 RepID=E0IGG6_9BACL|nr:hypothetical protein [Paenibacillus curdlanolyticus]EFM08466.1 conserved hypothetical protein [Paenibacillus curdlanolyticus YK9]